MSRTAAAEPPVLPMTRQEYHAWVEAQPRGRYERIHGIVFERDGATAMAPERSAHNQRKMLVWLALRRAIERAGLPCQAHGDGMTVQIDDSDFEPDAIVHCGAKLPDDAIAVPDPVIVVEVLSPSSRNTDRGLKLGEYFKLPSLHHYLIVWPDKPQIVHHRRVDAGGRIDTSIVASGAIRLDPPGMTITVEEIYA
jgi:Uma2 family endonuclease